MPNVYPDAYHVTTPTNLSTTGETTVYTVPATRRAAYVQELFAADTAGVARTLTVIARISGTDYTQIFQGSIDTGNRLELFWNALVLGASDSIKCTASNGSVHVTVNCLEIGDRGF